MFYEKNATYNWSWTLFLIILGIGVLIGAVICNIGFSDDIKNLNEKLDYKIRCEKIGGFYDDMQGYYPKCIK